MSFADHTLRCKENLQRAILTSPSLAWSVRAGIKKMAVKDVSWFFRNDHLRTLASSLNLISASAFIRLLP